MILAFAAVVHDRLSTTLGGRTALLATSLGSG
jgi:hypothetical protein